MKIGITGWGSISALGVNQKAIWENYLLPKHCFFKSVLIDRLDWGAFLNVDGVNVIENLAQENTKYKQLDPSVWYAIEASRQAVKNAAWAPNSEFGINIGSSRGATYTFEKYHRQFIESGNQITDPNTSPSTTLGNIASWVASDLSTNGPVISHSITCSTALHAIINAVAWLKAGFCNRFLAGGSEAPLTAFTLAQMKALKIYAQTNDEFPCRSMDLSKKQSGMVLGEGAASFCLEANPVSALAFVTGIGYGTEMINHGASLSVDAQCMQRSMQMALKEHDLEEIDAIVLHTPGTVLGDRAEIAAIEAVFGNKIPLLTSNKWKIGHTFGASGALSLELALLMILNKIFIQVPYIKPQVALKPIKKVMINAVGFGGNAVSIIVERD